MIERSVTGIRKAVIFNSEEVVNFTSDEKKIEIINSLKNILEIVREMEYENCSTSDYEALIDEEVVLDLLLDGGKLDKETAKEITENKDKYIKGEFTPKKVLKGIL